LIGRPNSLMKGKPAYRFPGVRPFQVVSKMAKYPQ